MELVPKRLWAATLFALPLISLLVASCGDLSRLISSTTRVFPPFLRRLVVDLMAVTPAVGPWRRTPGGRQLRHCRGKSLNR
ncbi:hypothetical protein [Neomoorella mulderi]|uniref:Uncharacterized protein n=1 Tax=Moorella mulderi DSM 14980 TaxID=1122241 RepID=A0A151AY36_9FIRM|nr:hypothetical protein [Moorella mulderi]KYH32462.1 hypothetical protein MOMUL_10630 [Moorella mulderi DSM 14980]